MTEDDTVRDGSGAPAELPLYLGPYEVWNFGVGRGYALPIMRKSWRFISALAELGAAGRNSGIARSRPGAWLPTLWKPLNERNFVPFVIENPVVRMPELEDFDNFLVSGFIDVMQPALDATAAAETSITEAADISLDRVESPRFRIAFPVTDAAMHKLASVPEAPIWHPDPDLRDRIGAGRRITVMAVIDDGIPFAHRHFRDAGGTRSRVEFCWLQSVAIKENQNSVLFGREYTREEIDHLIRLHGDDEDVLYREAGATKDTEELGSMIDRHATHGAHVMDLATGYAPERREEPAEDIRIIAVQLPNTIAWDTSGFGKDMYMLSAFHYIFDRADMIAAKEGYDVDKLRLVINFSYGFSGGRHDGGSELEAAIDELVKKRRELGCPTALVVPAGNTFLDRLHGLIRPSDFVDGAAQFRWRIQPNDRTPSYLELWFWQGFDPKGYKIELRDPQGRLRSELSIEIKNTGRAGEDPHVVEDIKNDLQRPVGQISVDVHRAGGKRADVASGRHRVLVVLAPTEPEDASLPRAESGQWTVVVKRGQAALIDHPIHCWIQRSADPMSLRSGSRQSYFDMAAHEETRFTPQGDLTEEDPGEDDTRPSFVRRFGSLSGLATGTTSLVVGGYRLGAGLGSGLGSARPSRYSSAGALHEIWPGNHVDCSSMSDRSRVLWGTVAAGVRSGSLSFVQGTSSAAPFVARQLAEAFATAESVDPTAIDNYLSLLSGRPSDPDDDKLTTARLGHVRVPPHRQPGLG
ncbi:MULTISPECIES: hypothetical protein [unclassified Bradyrhizobium]|uniref:hypothetical protein n=1 Tax=unclassified Bradyrhizobium TaxID=2631580 RepID=UPI0028E2F7CA|nr:MULTISPECIES: hypothetical protein [unclassified Bradyrhizobium]